LLKLTRNFEERLPARPFVHGRADGKALDGMLIRIKLARPLPAAATGRMLPKGELN